jgi:hypothetical protein
VPEIVGGEAFSSSVARVDSAFLRCILARAGQGGFAPRFPAPVRLLLVTGWFCRGVDRGIALEWCREEAYVGPQVTCARLA